MPGMGMPTGGAPIPQPQNPTVNTPTPTPNLGGLSGNLNNLLNDALYNLLHWSGRSDSACSVGLANVVAYANESVEVPVTIASLL